MKRKYTWRRQLPDARDYRRLVLGTTVPAVVDFRQTPYCPPIFDQGQLGSCHDDQTEVLTDSGWKLFETLTMNDKLASVCPKTFNLIYESPKRLIKLPYKGNLICVDNKSLNFKVTPDHKMVVRQWDQQNKTLLKDFEFVEAKNLGWYCGLIGEVSWQGHSSKLYNLPRFEHAKFKKHRTTKSINMSIWLKFLGIFLAEGTLLKEKYKIQIAAVKEREKTYVRQLLKDLGVTALELSDRFTFNDLQIWHGLKELGLFGKKAPEKFIPSFVFHQDKKHIKEFIHAYAMGDGCQQNNSISIYTSSKQIADGLQRLIFISGSRSGLYVRKPRTSKMLDGRVVKGKHPEHRISIYNSRQPSINRKQNIYEEFYDGIVYCAEVPTYHTLITRRKGKILISGNCTANSIAGAIQTLAMKEKLLDQSAPSRLFIYYNERVLEGTVLYDSGATIRDSVKATNQWGVCPESLWKYKDDPVTYRIKPWASCYKSALFHKALKYEAVDQTRQAMMEVLASGQPVLIGVSVYSSFESADAAKTGIIPMPDVNNEQLLGGHALCVIGYDQSKDWCIVRNSWGTSWGDSGYCYTPFNYLCNQNLASDFWTISLIGT